MKFSKTFSLYLDMSEFYELAIPLVPKSELRSFVRDEMNQCLEGIFEGGWGGTAISWERVLYINLYHQRVIEQTELSKRKFGDFSVL